ncbi:dipeptide epimerase [Raoultella sp. WB_B2P2-3]|uniref:Dipeptide epimerase n=1 Tax=Raoultella scottii TaxID=3040937 RepID=A0ABU8YZQ8_9ENTR
MSLTIDIWRHDWPMSEPFAIARGVQHQQATLQVRLCDPDGVEGRGETCGVYYAGDTLEKMERQLQDVIPLISQEVSRTELLNLLPDGGARHLIDTALWDLEAKRCSRSAFELAELQPRSVQSARTIGIRSLAEYQATASQLRDYPLLKVKVDAADPLAAILAVRTGAPNARLIIDPNQSWSVSRLKSLALPLAELGNIELIEQPIPVGEEWALDGWCSPVPLCADELINNQEDLKRAHGRFQYINIKLDKTGGLTTALTLADAAVSQGFGLMVGCMGGSSLSMAPAMVLAQRCAFVDLDGPLLQSEDCEPGFSYLNGMVNTPYLTELWG